ncbi:MAG: deoxyhypusine synthase family protein [Planctomycetota bacterium]|jgi:deoxyhypusine synthase
MQKKDFLTDPVKHIDIKSFDSTEIIDGMRDMSFTSRDTAAAADVLNRMINDENCTIILCIAGSTSAAGCMQIYADMVRHRMADVVVATGAAIVDMDFFEALGFRHYKGSPSVDDKKLREVYIDRIYDTFIDEEQLQVCDRTIKEIADSLPKRPYSSREFIYQMGKYLVDNSKKDGSLVQAAYENRVPIFCPAWELTEIKIRSAVSGLFIVGGGVPKNFAQDTVVCAEVLGRPVDMHKYAVQITVADVRDGACSGSTFKEASSWGKVDAECEQMVYAEATTVLPLIISYVYHRRDWENRPQRRWNKIFE